MNCVEFVELATEYLDGALAPEAARQFAAHLGECPACATYLDQLRGTISLLGQYRATSARAEVADARWGLDLEDTDAVRGRPHDDTQLA
jgi:anti-sigma factor RsiW